MRYIFVFSLVLVAATNSNAADPPVSNSDPERQLQLKLAKVVSMKDPIDAAIDLALTELAEEHGLQGKIVFCKEAFKAEGIDDPLAVMVKLPKLTGVRFCVILDRLVGQMGGAWVLRDGHIEITTAAAVRAEINVNDADPDAGFKRTMPLVRSTLKDIPLRKALEDLASRCDRTVIVAPQAGEKGDVQVSARFVNVPLDTAVELLADMAELKLVRKANALYVTTPEKAEPLLAEEEKRRETIRRQEELQLRTREIEAKKPAMPPEKK